MQHGITGGKDDRKQGKPLCGQGESKEKMTANRENPLCGQGESKAKMTANRENRYAVKEATKQR